MRYSDFSGDLIRGSGLPSSSILVVSRTIASSDLPSYSGTCFLISSFSSKITGLFACLTGLGLSFILILVN